MSELQMTLRAIGDFLWGPWTTWALLTAGIVFTVWTRFTQYRALTHGVAVVLGKYDDPSDPGAINHFQALSAALSATIGLGNIGAVALAIGMGGPGALFWMWLVGALGMALKTAEITLAMMYRNTDDPENPHGGAMWVVDAVIGGRGGAWKPLARSVGIFFCITLLISTFTGGNMFQAWSVAQLTRHYFNVPQLASGFIIAAVVGMVIVGGIKRIGQVAGQLVPVMCMIYLLSALTVLAVNVTEIPSMLALIVRSAFNGTEATGAFLGGTAGFAFMQGMRRALFSNEAGQGSAPIAHSAAKTSEPAREGIVGGMGPFIDTLCICTLTALVLLSTGTWNREAVGDFGRKLRLTRDPAAAVPTWRVDGWTDVNDLPPLTDDQWNDGTPFFLIAEVEGAKHIESGSRRVQVQGEVVAASGDGDSRGTNTLALAWQPVQLAPEHWAGTPTNVRIVDQGVRRSFDGAVLTGHAFDREFPGLGKWLVTVAAWLFALSTMISWSYYGEQGMVYVLGDRSVLPYKLVFLAGTVYAAAGIENTAQMIALMDIGTGAMLWANIPIVLCLGHLAVRCLNDYGRRLHAGQFPRR